MGAEPGAAAYQPLIDRFGADILDADDRIDRPALAAKVFGHPEELEALNAIIHPAIGVAMIDGKDAYKDTDRIVVMDIPLLKTFHRDLLALDAVVVVDAPPEVRSATHRAPGHVRGGRAGPPGVPAVGGPSAWRAPTSWWTTRTAPRHWPSRWTGCGPS